MTGRSEAGGRLRVLNLYAGLGGNRRLWDGVSVTAVESDPRIAAVYGRFYPEDEVVVGDAHAYLLENYGRFDFIWSSPPCQTHSRMARATRHSLRRYPDMSLYQQVVFLRHYAACLWVVENVVPYYKPLIEAKRVGRHLFWSNFAFEADAVPTPPGFITGCNLAGKRALQAWLGIHFEETLYYGKNHCPAQVLRNCVHPDIGAQILDAARAHLAGAGPAAAAQAGAGDF